MAHTHEFDCKVCGAHLDSQKELNEHTQKQHASQASPPGSPSGGATNRTSGTSVSNG